MRLYNRIPRFLSVFPPPFIPSTPILSCKCYRNPKRTPPKQSSLALEHKRLPSPILLIRTASPSRSQKCMLISTSLTCLEAESTKALTRRAIVCHSPFLFTRRWWRGTVLLLPGMRSRRERILLQLFQRDRRKGCMWIYFSFHCF